ncbi:MAG: oligosaccharide flippase family protein, partial [Deltaproteobacteria bacterium]|nr:oligosaccharide flippase family protein [Deltaproteobacteria bacterium]
MKDGKMDRPTSGAGSRLMTGSIRIFLADALILPTGFITAVFLARKLGPADYGLFALVSMLVLWIEWGSTTLFSHTTVKFVGEAKDWEPVGTTVIQLHLVVGIGLAILVWFLSSPLSRLFNEPAMANHLRLYAVDIPIFGLACANSNILVGRGYFKERARISAGRRIARLVLIVLFVEMGLSVTGAVMGMIGASVVEFIISRFYVRPSLFSRATFPVRHLVGFAAPLFLSALSLSIIKLDLFALKVLGGTAALAGIYGAARNLSLPLGMLSGSLSPPLLSTLSHLLSEGDEPGAKEIGLNALRSVMWLVPFAAMTAG